MIADGRKERIGNHLVSVNKMYYPEIGGVEVVAQRIAELGLHLFDKSTVITFNKENSMVEEEINGVHVIRLNTAYRKDPIRLSSNFGRVLRQLLVGHYRNGKGIRRGTCAALKALLEERHK